MLTNRLLNYHLKNLTLAIKIALIIHIFTCIPSIIKLYKSSIKLLLYVGLLDAFNSVNTHLLLKNMLCISMY